VSYLERLVTVTGSEWVSPDEADVPGGGPYSTLDRRDPWSVPMFHELAADVLVVARRLLDDARGLDTGSTPPATATGISL
jgi:hypothetical protein